MIKFHKKQISDNKIDQWINLEQNVVLIGQHGTGKTARILEGFKRNKLKYAYFSGSTLDPWVHVIGVPKVKEKDGKEWLDFILPQNMDDDIEAIFIDEYNRTPSIIRNALLELQQFKSINGRKFPKLKLLWAAINPAKDDDQEDQLDYDVEELDMAQLDRFEIIVEVPEIPDKKYFVKTHGSHTANILIDWWKKQPKVAKEILSPRRLDKIGMYHKKGGDVTDMLPCNCDAKSLLKNLSVTEKDSILNRIFENPTDEVFKQFVKDDKNFLQYEDKLKDSKFWSFYHHLNPEYVDKFIKEDNNFKIFAIYQALLGKEFFIKRIEEVSKSKSNKLLEKTYNLLHKKDVIKDYKSASENKRMKCNFPVFDNKMGNDLDAFTGNTYIVSYGCKTNLNEIDPREYRKLVTQQYKSALASLCKSFRNENIYDSVSFMLATYLSFQKGTISSIRNYQNIFGSVMLLAKEKLDVKYLKKIVICMHQAGNKMNCHDEIIQFLSGNGDMSGDIVPKGLVSEIQNITDILELSEMP